MECVSKPYPRYAGEGREGERCGRLIQIREGRVSKPYPRYVGVGCDGKLYPRYAEGVVGGMLKMGYGVRGVR